MKDLTQYLTVKEAAAALGQSEGKLRQRLKGSALVEHSSPEEYAALVLEGRQQPPQQAVLILRSALTTLRERKHDSPYHRTVSGAEVQAAREAAGLSRRALTVRLGKPAHQNGDVIRYEREGVSQATWAKIQAALTASDSQ